MSSATLEAEPDYASLHRYASLKLPPGHDTYVQLGGFVYRAQSSISRETTTPAESLDAYDELHRDALESRADEMLATGLGIDLAPSGHLKVLSLRHTMHQIACQPAIAQQTDQSQNTLSARRKLAAGSQEPFVLALDIALQTLPATKDRSTEEQYLIGLINELTVHALINNPLIPDRLTRPALPHEDIRMGFDAIVDFIKCTGAPPQFTVTRRYLQIKSNENLMGNGDLFGQLIGGVALGNQKNSLIWHKRGRLQTAQAIVERAKNTITPEDERILDNISRRLIGNVEYGYDFAVLGNR